MRHLAPDDVQWLTVEPDIQLVDLQVFRQLGVPEPVLALAVRRARTAPAPGLSPGLPAPSAPGCGVPITIGADLSFLDELVEDPDCRPYIWDIPEGED